MLLQPQHCSTASACSLFFLADSEQALDGCEQCYLQPLLTATAQIGRMRPAVRLSCLQEDVQASKYEQRDLNSYNKIIMNS